MLSEEKLKTYLSENASLSTQAIDYINQVRSSEPSRAVGVNGRKNVCSSVYSEKMGWTISVESRTAERAFLYLCEYDDEVIEIWDQPEPVKVQVVNKKGKRQSVYYTPDFLILTTNGPLVVEVKTETKLKSFICAQNPNWKENEGDYSYIPGKNAFGELGLNLVVFYPSETTAILVANIQLLLEARKTSIEPVLVRKLDSLFKHASLMTIETLRTELGCDSIAPILKLIDGKALHAKLNTQLLSNTESTVVSRNPNALVLVECETKIGNREDFFESNTIVFPSEQELEQGLQRKERLESGEISRSTQRWNRLLKTKAEPSQSDLIALCPKFQKRGNRKPKIPSIVADFLKQFVQSEVPNLLGLSVSRAHVIYLSKAREAHPNQSGVSLPTFTKCLEKVDVEARALQRGGKRLASHYSAPSNPESRHIKQEVPWLSASIDHYLADIFIVFHTINDVAYVARPWLTAMIDNYTKEVLATTFSFRRPSRVACAKVIRESVRNHGKLPSEIIVDHGSDFKSVYFRSLLAHFEVTLTYRPSSNSRYGGEIERFFGQCLSEWLCMRPGNTAGHEEARKVDGRKAASNMAVLSPSQFSLELAEYCNWKMSKPLAQEVVLLPNALLKKKKDFDFIGKKVAYNKEFILASAVDSKRYRVDPQRGIHIGAFHYYSEKLKLHDVRKHVEVRIDPENPYLVFALINGAWEACYHSRVNSYLSMSQHEQFEKGLVLLEAKHLIKKLQLEADIKLASLISQFELQEPEQSTEAESVTREEAYKREAQVFSIDSNQIPDIEVGGW